MSAIYNKVYVATLLSVRFATLGAIVEEGDPIVEAERAYIDAVGELLDVLTKLVEKRRSAC